MLLLLKAFELRSNKQGCAYEDNNYGNSTLAIILNHMSWDPLGNHA